MDRTFVIGIVLALIALAVMTMILVFTRKKRSEHLKSRFGPEYEEVLRQHRDSRDAEAVLVLRERRVEAFSIEPLPESGREFYAREWASLQNRFVDDPAASVHDAETLLDAVMAARGYPIADFEQRAADISVNYPQIVQNYRAGRQIAMKHSEGKATTEELRQAMVYYRSLFDELLEAPAEENRATERSGNEGKGVTHERIAS